ncbi:uncharacterized protein RJT20DRAFT_132129 [Scheffersomyces xylosifermentans]|uniref:uncharacterized protein n=1 Tax=Scheffersomyces xylosifermentans TaxID=1304137 RepID=UPI00315CA83D
MDLSNLSSNLPPTKPVNQGSIDELSQDLTTEFKNAAKSVAALYNSSISGNTTASNHKVEFANAARSVAALYRLTHNSNSLLHHKGYLQCLDDLLEVITNDGDIENWALTRKAEISNMHNASTQNTQSTTSEVNVDKVSSESENVFQIPLDYEFSLSSDLKPLHHFRPSVPPMSVQHKQRSNFKLSRRLDPLLVRKLQQQSQSSEDSSSDGDSEESAERDAEERVERKKNIQDDSQVTKKKKNNPTSSASDIFHAI